MKCEIDGGIQFMSPTNETMIEKVIAEQRLRNIVIYLSDNQFGFLPGGSDMELIIALRLDHRKMTSVCTWK